MKIAIKIVATILLVCTFFSQANAQHKDTSDSVRNSRDTSTKVIVTLKDQSTIKGVIIAINLEEISLKTEFAGIVVIKQSNILSIVNYLYSETQSQQYPRIYNPNNPNDLDIIKLGGSTNYYKKPYTPFSNNYRYNFSNNYIGSKKNELTYNNIWVLYNSLDYGINDNLGIGGGVLFLGFVGFINILGRGQIHLNENIKIGASYNYFMVLDAYRSSSSSQSANFGLLSAGVTITGKKGNITLSIVNLNNDNNRQNNGLTINGFSLSGSLDISEKTSIVSDNVFISEKTNPRSYSLGIRIKGKSGNVDFGIMSLGADENVYNYNTNSYGVETVTQAIPFLALTQKIN